MSTPPVCPRHNVPMAVSKWGGFYCPNRDESGEYCREKVPAPKPTSISTVPASSLLPNRDVLAAACLAFASELFKGAGPEMGQDALNVAKQAFKEMRECQ